MEDLGYTKTDKKILMVLEDKVRIIQYDTRNLEVQTLKEIQRKTGEVEMDWVFRGYCGTMMDALNFIVNKDLLMDYATIAKVEELKTTLIYKGTITVSLTVFANSSIKDYPDL